jgi:hypothetical protein
MPTTGCANPVDGFWAFYLCAGQMSLARQFAQGLASSMLYMTIAAVFVL